MQMKNIVVIGGGCGTHSVLRSLREFPAHLSAVVSMADDGGSTGALREAYGVLPPGDVRQCLLALSLAPPEVRAMFEHRYADGPLKGHTVGNIMLASLEMTTGSFESAVATAAKLLNVNGTVIPVTLDNVRQGIVDTASGTRILGQHRIDESRLLNGPWKVFLESVMQEGGMPRPVQANPKALQAFAEADAIIIGPGSHYTSTMPVFFIPGVAEAIRTSRGRLILNVNLVTTPGHTDDWTATRFIREVETVLDRKVDHATFNTSPIPKEVLDESPGSAQTLPGDLTDPEANRIVGADIAYKSASAKVPGDAMVRSFVRHDPDLLGPILWRLINA